LSLFDRIIIFEPWYSELPGHLKKIDAIEVRYPPESLKPGDKFLHLLAEYKGWIAQHADKGYVDFLKANQDMAWGEETTWEIRKSLQSMGKERQSATQENLTLRWHMVLHLARELEEQRQEADQALQRLKERKSPLEGVLEDESELKDLFDDIPRFADGPPGGAYNIALVLEAWVRLFGGYLKEADFLLTTDPAVLEYLSEMYSEHGGSGNAGGENPVSFRWPDLSNLNLEDMREFKEGIRSNDQLGKLRSIIVDMANDPRGSLGRLREYPKDLEWKGSRGNLEFQVRYLDPKQFIGREKEDSAMKVLSGKTTFLLRDQAR